MRMTELAIAVLMQQRSLKHRWVDDVWSAVAAVPADDGSTAIKPVQQTAESLSYLVSGLRLELYLDENDGYFENWVAPEPKVFVMWRMQDGLALPVLASVSYAEGTRMLDSGEAADGVPMAPEIHAWLGEYLQQHYQPPQRHGRHLSPGVTVNAPSGPPVPGPSG